MGNTIPFVYTFSQREKDLQEWPTVREQYMRCIFDALIYARGYPSNLEMYYPLLTLPSPIAHLIIEYIGSVSIRREDVALLRYEIGIEDFATYLSRVEDWPEYVTFEFLFYHLFIDIYDIRLLFWQAGQHPLPVLFQETQIALASGISACPNRIRYKLLSSLLIIVHEQTMREKKQRSILFSVQRFYVSANVTQIISSAYVQWIKEHPYILWWDLYWNGISYVLRKTAADDTFYLDLQW